MFSLSGALSAALGSEMTRSLFLCGFQDAYMDARNARSKHCRRTARAAALRPAVRPVLPQGVPRKRHTISGGYGWRVPPVPIPNTEVKPPHADGTWLETARESRSLPDSNLDVGEVFASPTSNNILHAFLSSSMAEHSAVNRRVVSSSLT